MNNQNPVNYIGKHISEFPINVQLDTKPILITHIYNTNVDYEFLGRSYKQLGIHTDKDDLIKSISITIWETMNISFYNDIINSYGNPSQVLKPKTSEVKENDYALQSCLFEDNPVFIFWKNSKGFDIEVQINRSSKFTRIAIGAIDFKNKVIPEIPSLLGQNIKEAELIGINTTPKRYLNILKNQYHNREESGFNFLGKLCHPRISTNDNNAIKNVSFVLIGAIDRPFYNILVKEYGIPQSLLVIDQTSTNGPTKGDYGTSQEWLYSTKEGTFEDNPLSIVWRKRHYQINISITPPTTPKAVIVTEITFTQPNDDITTMII